MIRVNSQSGKGGVAYVMKSEHKLDLPRRLQIEFSRVVQEQTDGEGGEMSLGRDLGGLPARVPHPRGAADAQLRAHLLGRGREGPARRERLRRRRDPRSCTARATARSRRSWTRINGLPDDFDVRVLDYAEHALSSGGDAIAAAYVECAVGEQILWGVGLDANIVTASLKAVISAVNRR